MIWQFVNKDFGSNMHNVLKAFYDDGTLLKVAVLLSS
jgi:hypothetical protein